MTPQPSNPYDQIPYDSQAFPQTHPGHLAAMARMFGMSPAPVESSRVLELGCASGGNLIPMAATLPKASFLGLDLSARQIGDGQSLIAQLGLTNIELRQLDLRDVDESLGKFDYIIAHGVYSWVPPDVQDKLLAICAQNLATNGVAFVSYNTYPGWRMRGMLRDAMVYHARQFADPAQQVKQARALIDFLAQNVPTENNPYGLLLKQELQDMRLRGDSYLAHEHLESENEPTFFHQFADKAAGHRLQYLADADLGTMLAAGFPPQVAETLRLIAPDAIRMEQYMDFLRNRAFRQSLLVHQGVRVNRNLTWKSLSGLHISSWMQREGDEGDLASSQTVKFRAPNGAILATGHPITKAGLTILAQRSPRDVLFEELCVAARNLLNGLGSTEPNAQGASDEQILGSELIQSYAYRMIAVRAVPWRFAAAPGPFPRASALARLQCERGSTVATLRHESATLDPFSQQLLRVLDGQKDRAALYAIVAELIRNGVLSIKNEDKSVADPDAAKEIITAAIEESLRKFAQAALLEE